MCILISKCYSTTLLKDQINRKMFASEHRTIVHERTTNANQYECIVLATQISTLVLS